MGHFSELDWHLQEKKARRVDHSCPLRPVTLRDYLEGLNERLAKLNDSRPHGPLHPLYARYFYEDYLTHQKCPI